MSKKHPIVAVTGASGAGTTVVEKSFRENRPKALVQMATGSGKTFTAITSIYRLLKFAKACQNRHGDQCLDQRNGATHCGTPFHHGPPRTGRC